LERLQILRIDNNEVSELPSSISKSVSLRLLSANGNQLKTLPSGLESSKMLKIIQLRQNPIADEEQKKIQNRFPNQRLAF
jgi:Leucine-rich repeat (LRR) protein